MKVTIALPDWNDLPQEARRALVEEAEFYVEHPSIAGDCAVNFYGKLRRIISDLTAPPEVKR